MSLWYEESFRDLSRFALRTRETLMSRQSEFQKVELIDTVQFGRVLVIDGVFMTSERDEHLYHEMIVHPAMVTHPNPQSVLVIGGGDGGTAREVLRHPTVQTCTMVEIDALVVEACKLHLPSLGAWDDPRLQLRIEDGIQFVRETDARFDIVILDGTDPQGPAEGLFNESFYRNVHRVLRSGGIFALQSEGPFFFPEVFRAIQVSLAKVFAQVAPYFGSVPLYSAGPWSWTWASDRQDLTPSTLPATSEKRAVEIEKVTRYWNREIQKAAFALPSELRKV
ncbi:MAG: polyamine aminopropyltransferase [Myxococcota bacterium]